MLGYATPLSGRQRSMALSVLSQKINLAIAIDSGAHNYLLDPD